MERRQDYTQLHADMAATREKVDILYTVICGNGQPGAIANIETSVKELEGRVVALEGWRKWVNGVSATLGTIFAVIAAFWHYIIVVRVGKSGG